MISIRIDVNDLSKFIIINDRKINSDLSAGMGTWIKKIVFWTNAISKTCNKLLSNGIQWRICYLRKKL